MNNYGQLGIGNNVNVGDTAATLGNNFDLVLLGTGFQLPAFLAFNWGFACGCYLHAVIKTF
jgi:hypothetical protein